MKKSLIALLIFAVTFTQIIPYPVAYAINFVGMENEVERAIDQAANVVMNELGSELTEEKVAEAATAQAAQIIEEGPVRVASAPNQPDKLYDLVALVVEKEVYDDTASYVGLRSQYPGLSGNTLRQRVLRYAEDVVDNNPLTDVKVLIYDRGKDSAAALQEALQNLYINGDGTHNNKLSGVVLVGEVPIPVIDKNGNRFASVFPYTDLADSAYIYNEESQSFEYNAGSEPPKAEIWHGVIRAPSNDTAGLEELAGYFDKNHLYYEGEPEFASFEKKMFFADFIREKEKINKDAYGYYLKYLEGLEDLAYFRYNKHWANELTQNLVGGLSDDFAAAAEGPDGTDILTEEGHEYLDKVNDSGGSGGAGGIPDIQTKTIIDQTLKPYYQLLTKYIAEINDWTQYTGRYLDGETDSVPGLISMKDEYAKVYLRSVNDALEKQINAIAEKMQEPITILKYSNVSGRFGSGQSFQHVVGTDSTTGDDIFAPINLRFAYYDEVANDDTYYKNGIDLEVLNSPKQCSVFLGSTKDSYYNSELEFDPKRLPNGEYSILTRASRADDPGTAIMKHVIGVNTRLLTPAQASDLTNGQFSSGAIIEDNDEYGVKAFEDNFLVPDYSNPFDGPLKKGDVIVRVGGFLINGKLPLEQAVENIFSEAKQDLETRGVGKLRKSISIEYYRNGSRGTVSKTFTVTDVGYPILGKNAVASDGAIYALNSVASKKPALGENGFGYGDRGTDNAAGCNALATAEDSDRCFYQIAKTPILDPAGGTELRNVDGNLQFKENYKTSDTDEHVGFLQWPDGYKFEQIDEVYLNSCFEWLPSIAATNSQLLQSGWDGNEYKYPLDHATSVGTITNYPIDLYGRLLQSIGKILENDHARQHIWEARWNLHWPEVAEAVRDMDSADIVLNSARTDDATGTFLPEVTLKLFSDRYGLFDGIDNNGDGIVDNACGIGGLYCEANIALYGLDAGDTGAIGRKLLSKSGSYTIPAQNLPGQFSGTGGLTLNITAVPYKTISSVIIHNEPTNYTISQQLESAATESLPIDNPRYVAFQGAKGKVYKITYPNSFKAGSYPQLQANLSALASQIALLPDAYKIFGPTADPDDYTPLDIKNEILNNYLTPPISGTLDDPISGYDLKTASAEKIFDALDWLSLGIDAKHKYVLETYLNPEKNAYVNDNNLGYESAYLVFDGKDGQIDSFSMNFNKGLPEETDPDFDPLSNQGDEVDESEPEEESGGDDEGNEAGVPIWEWLDKELFPFIESLQSFPELEQSCVFTESAGDDEDGEGDGGYGEGTPVGSITLSSNKLSFPAKSGQKVELTVQALDENGQPTQTPDSNTVELEIIQDSGNPVVYDYPAVSTFYKGKAIFSLTSTGNFGNVVVAACSPYCGGGFVSNNVSLSTESLSGELLSSTYFVPEGIEATLPEEPESEPVSAPTEEPPIEESLPPEEGEPALEENSQPEGEEPITEEEPEIITAEPEAGENAFDENELADIIEEDETDYSFPESVGEISEPVITETPQKGKIIVLVSDPIKQITLYSTLIDDPATGELTEIQFQNWEEYFELKEYHKNYLGTTTTGGTDEPADWKNYFFEKSYHQKYLAVPEVPEVGEISGEESATEEAPVSEQATEETEPETGEPQASQGRLLASLVSDATQMPVRVAYIPDNQNPYVDADENLNSKYIVEQNDEMVADGISLMKLEAQIYRADGTLDRGVQHQVTFAVQSEIPDIVTFEGNKQNSNHIVTTTTGSAITYIKAGRKTGSFKVVGYLDGGASPFFEKELYLVAGDPYAIEIKADTGTLVANGESKATLEFVVRDRYGNLADNSFDQIGVFASREKAVLDESADTNGQLPGIQLRTNGGKAFIDLQAKNETGQVKVIAVLMDYDLEQEFIAANGNFGGIDFSKEIGNSKVFRIVDDVDLRMTLSSPSIVADGTSIVRVKTELIHNNQVVADFNGPIDFSILTDDLLEFVSKPPSEMIRGELHEANLRLRAKTLSGDGELLVNVPGFVAETVAIDLKAGPARQIELTATPEVLETNGSVQLKARVLDSNGNLIEDDNSTIITFSATEATASLIEFTEAASAVALGGVATARIQGLSNSGVVNLKAQATGLKKGTLSLEVNGVITKQDVKNFAPRVLYTSLLGGAFGNPVDSDNLAQTLLYNSHIQTVASVTAAKNDSKRLLSLDGFGRLQSLADSISFKVVQASDSFPYQKILVSDSVAGKELASIFLVPETGVPITLINSAEEKTPETEGVYVQNLSTDTHITFEQTSSEIVIKKDGELKVKIDRFGRVSLLDNKFEMVIPKPDDPAQLNDFGFLISDNGALVGSLVFKQNFGVDVKKLAYRTIAGAYQPGIYLLLSSADNMYDAIPSFSRDSTANPKGLYLIDKTQPLDVLQAPGFGSQSLESAENDGGIGFEGANKHMLLFSAGNTVGASQTPYASEVGIVYGDPLVRLPVGSDEISEVSNYTKDIGESVFASDTTIKEMINFDYDGDGRDDLLLAYEDGLLRLLKNEISGTPLRDMGYLLKIVGGVMSMTKIDVNNDGYDDLIAGTEESCREGEVCLSLFTNEEGHFKRETLSLAIAGKVKEMKAGDVNNDGCEDLVLSDTSGNVRIFYNLIKDGQCSGLDTNYGYSRNFGFSVDATQNIAKNLFIYYPGVEAFDELEYSNVGKFIQFVLPVASPPGGPSQEFALQGQAVKNLVLNKPEIASKTVPDEPFSRKYYFFNLKEDDRFKLLSDERTIDVNGGVVELNDQIDYLITLRNASDQDVNNMMLSDALTPAMELDESSLKCLDSGCTDNLEWVDTGIKVRSKIIKGISVPAGGTRTIQYSMKVVSMPEVHFELGRDFVTYPSGNGDPYLDIRVRPQVNPSKEITYLYSTGINNNRVQYARYTESGTADPSAVLKKRFEDRGLPDPAKLIELTSQFKTFEEGDELPDAPDPSDDAAMADYFEELGMSGLYEDKELQKDIQNIYQGQNKDRDYDGLPDSWDPALFYPSASSSDPQANALLASSMSQANAVLRAAQNKPEVASCLVEKAFASARADTDPTDGSIGASAEFDIGGEAAEAVANEIENVTNMLRCQGAGCLPIPYNYTFLAPDMIVPGAVIPGISVISVLSRPPFVQPLGPSTDPTSTFRLYIAPTLTMGLGIGVCGGPGGVIPFGLCWVAAVPVQALTGCDKILDEFLNGVLAQIDNAVHEAESATGGMVSGGNSGGEGFAEDENGETIDFFPDDFPAEASLNYNIRIPGFPSVITDWIDRQTDEIYNKLLDFPDIYLILPDFVKLYQDTAVSLDNFTLNQADLSVPGGIQGIHDFLRAVNTIPFIQIESKEVTLELPAISKREVERFAMQFKAWKDYHEQYVITYWEDLKEFYSCDEGSTEETACDKLLLDMSEFIKSVEKFMNDLEELQKLPRKILSWRYLEAKYAMQIICYIDAIVTVMGGYVRKQMRIVEKWLDAVEQVIRMITEWKIIIDLIIDFKVTCDQCKNDRFSRLGLLLQLLVAIPSPPVIPIPKWPDLVFDFSQLSTGAKIVWPDVQFKPVPIYLPSLPYLYLPNIVPEIELKVPGFIVNFPDFTLPELPDLPPLPLPQLPDLPNPPEIPQLPDLIFQLALNLKPIFKILCLLKLALMPVPEFSLGTEIETLTQPNVNIVLPIIARLAINLPPIEYDFVREIRATLKMDFSIQTDFIYLVVKSGTDIWNKGLRTWVDEINSYLSYDLQALVNKWLDEFYGALFDQLGAALGLCVEQSGNEATVSNTAECTRQAVEETLDACIERANQGEIGERACQQALAGYLADEEPNNLEAQNIVSELKAGLEDDQSKVWKEVDYSKYYGEGQGETDGGETLGIPESQQLHNILDQEESILNEAQSAALLSYEPFNQIVNNFSALTNQLNAYVAGLDYSDTPDTYYLTATQEYLDSSHPLLNRDLAEIERNIALEDLPDIAGVRRLASLRDGLIAYVKEMDNTNELLKQVEDYEEFGKILVKNNQSLGRIAALSTPSVEPENNALNFNFLNKDTESRLLAAANIGESPGIDQSDAFANSSGIDASGFKGIFVINPETGENENVLRYTAELDGPTQMLFSDVDQDGDMDMIYALNGDVYLKTNYKENRSLGRGGVLSLNNKINISDYQTAGGSRVQSVSSPYESATTADVSWTARGGDVAGYEILVRRSLEDSYAEAIASFRVEGANTTSYQIEIGEGNYYASVFAISSSGARSLVSEPTYISPQICADKEAPFPVASETEISVPLFKTFEVDGINSFDPNGEIKEYYLETLPYTPPVGKSATPLRQYIWSDLNLLIDSSGDGIPVNDRDNPVFRVGPFVNEGDIGAHEFLLHVADAAGNTASQKITVSVFVPEISLDETVARSGVVSGKTDPGIGDTPFSLMRQRYLFRVVDGKLVLVPRLEKITTGSIGAFEKYYTADGGQFEIRDLDLTNMILVENSRGEIVAEINPETGNIGVLKQDVFTVVRPATPPLTPTTIDIVEGQGRGRVLGTVYVIADPNIDTEIYQNFGFTADNTESLTGVHIDDVNVDDQFILVTLPLNHPAYPGGTAIVNTTTNKQVALIDTAGNILLLDSALTLQQKKNNHISDPLIIQIISQNRVIAEVYTAGLPGFYDQAIIVGPDDVPAASPRSPAADSLYGLAQTNLNGVSDELSLLVEDLFKRGVMEGQYDENGLSFDLEKAVTRREFVKVLINLLCIVPREPEAYQPFTAEEGGGYPDVPYSETDPYFPYIKEGTLLGLVHGYQGEMNQINGLPPFRPNQVIDRSEAVKVLLKALEFKGIIDLSDLPPYGDKPWYLPMMQAATDLTPYLTGDILLQNNFIITEDEAIRPDEKMDYEALLTMVNRVIEIYSCFEIDSDQDGMSDFCEAKYGIDDPSADEDGDDLINILECTYGTDPTDQDTDKGGSLDGAEFKYGTNMLNPVDDPIDDDSDGLTNAAEILIYKTNPQNPDTDSGGIDDGTEVLKNYTNPLAGDDDGKINALSEGKEGVYIVPASCDTCPCASSFLFKAQMIDGDTIFAVISDFAEKVIFSKSNEISINGINK